jgi:ActR/RegA family two-component response regulator
MFEHCRAFVIAANAVETRALELTAHNLGFGEVASRLGGSGATLSRAVITYFFVDYRLADDELLDVIDAVREERSARLCYSPVILFTDDCPYSTMLKYVRFGFDDVVGLPQSRDVLAERLAEQLDSELVYVEAKDYLGPDRRRLDSGAELRVGISSHTRVTFVRDARHGIRVLRREERGHRFRARPEPGTHFMPKLFGHRAV